MDADLPLATVGGVRAIALHGVGEQRLEGNRRFAEKGVLLRRRNPALSPRRGNCSPMARSNVR
jgi:hypothetical protein